MFAVGEKFASYADLEQKVQLLERTKYVTFHQTQSRLLDRAIKNSHKVSYKKIRYKFFLIPILCALIITKQLKW